MPAAWPAEQVQCLKENWGHKSIPVIAQMLGRTVQAVKLKAGKLKLGRHLNAGDEISFNQLCVLMGQQHSYGHYKKYWPQHDFPFRHKKSINKKYTVVSLKEFWLWAKAHKNLLDFSRFKAGALGDEPGWVEAKRQADIKSNIKYKKTPWTPDEDRYLISLLESHQYGYRDISERLQRTEGAIKRRCFDLDLKMRPVRKSPHDGKWKSDQIETTIKLHRAGYMPDIIAGYVNKSACAVRGLLERLAAKGELESSDICLEGITKGKHYRLALPPEQWPMAERFLKLIIMAKQHAVITNQKPNIDLNALREMFSKMERGD